MKEEQPWLFVEHVAMNRCDIDPVGSQRPDHWIDLVPCQHEVASNCRFTATGRLEIDGLRHPHRPDGADFHSAFADWIAARHGELINAAIVLSPRAEDLVELRGIEIDRGWRVCLRGGERSLAPGERILNHPCHFDRIAMAADMHVKRSGAGAQQMIVYRSDLKTAFN